VVQVRGDPAGIKSDSQIGTARLALAELAAQHLQLLQGETVEVQAVLHPKKKVAAAASGGNASSKGGSTGGSSRAEVELAEAAAAAVADVAAEAAAAAGDVAAPDAAAPAAAPAATSDAVAPPAAVAAAAAAAPTLAAAPSDLAQATVSFEVELEAVSCLDAAVDVGLTSAAAQTCLAMFAAPGGLYLDVKSAYSTPRDLQVGGVAWVGGSGKCGIQVGGVQVCGVRGLGVQVGWQM